MTAAAVRTSTKRNRRAIDDRGDRRTRRGRGGHGRNHGSCRSRGGNLRQRGVGRRRRYRSRRGRGRGRGEPRENLFRQCRTANDRRDRQKASHDPRIGLAKPTRHCPTPQPDVQTTVRKQVATISQSFRSEVLRTCTRENERRTDLFPENAFQQRKNAKVGETRGNLGGDRPDSNSCSSNLSHSSDSSHQPPAQPRRAKKWAAARLSPRDGPDPETR